MKLAEALALRSDAQKRLAQLQARAVASARYQEGEEPPERAGEVGSRFRPERARGRYAGGLVSGVAMTRPRGARGSATPVIGQPCTEHMSLRKGHRALPSADRPGR